MAKKLKVAAASDCEYKPSIYIDTEALKDLKGLSVGDEVRVVITGKVKSIEQRASYDNPEKVQGSVSLTDFEADFIPVDLDIESLINDEED